MADVLDDTEAHGGARWIIPLVAAICVFVCADACIVLTRQAERICAIWVPNAIVLALLLRRPTHEWTAILAGDAVGNIGANLVNHIGLAADVGLALVNVVEVLFCALSLRMTVCRREPLDLARFRSLSVFVALTVGFIPICSGLLAATLLGHVAGAGFVHVFRQWYAAHAIGLLTLTPLLVGFEFAEMAALFRRDRIAKTTGCLLLMAATLALVFSQSACPLLFLAFPSLMVVNFQLGFAGVVVALAMTVVAATGATLEGTGPLMLVKGHMREQVLLLQAFIAVAGLSALQLAAVLATRARLETDLRRANADAEAEIVARKASEAMAELARREAETAREAALEASRAKSDFVAAMSHEIRTPLNSIIGFTGLMLDNETLAGGLRRQTEIVRTAGTSLLTVIDDILHVSKIEAGMVEIEQVAFDPGVVLGHVIEMARGIAATKGYAVTLTIDPDLPARLVGDQARLRQVLLNLLNNAVKFTDHGFVALDVSVGSERADGIGLRFTVTDTGVGIASRHRDRIFQRFGQADASINRRYGGSGLGLAICKQLVELMGGEIGFASEEGRGSTFWFTLSLPRAADEAGPVLVAEPRPVAGGRLLLVEDVDANQLLARTLLEADGHAVDVVATGEAAIEAVQATPYDLVLMDVQMPGMGGVDATKAIRSLPSCRELPIVAMTANVMSEQIATFRDAGMDDHIGKPIDRAEMRRTVAEWLGKRHPTSVHRAFDSDVFERLAGVLGPTKTRDALAMFARNLENRLQAAAAATIGEYRQDAHVIMSIAGVLGFTDLAQRCAGVNALPPDGEAIDAMMMAGLFHAREGALSRLEALLAEMPVPRAA